MREPPKTSCCGRGRRLAYTRTSDPKLGVNVRNQDDRTARAPPPWKEDLVRRTYAGRFVADREDLIDEEDVRSEWTRLRMQGARRSSARQNFTQVDEPRLFDAGEGNDLNEAGLPFARYRAQDRGAL